MRGSLFILTGVLFLFLSVVSLRAEQITRTAWIQTDHVVYRPGEPVVAKIWLSRTEAFDGVHLRILDGVGDSVHPVTGAGRERLDRLLPMNVAGRPLSRSHPGRVVTIGDLRDSFDLTRLGTYTLSLHSGSKGNAPNISPSITVTVAEPSLGDRIIPLSDVWALNMPGTRRMDVRFEGATGAYLAPEGRLVAEIVAALADSPGNTTPGAVFAVSGTGLNALREAHRVLAGGVSPISQFKADDMVTLVFFSRSFNFYIHLDRVEQRGSTVEVAYRMIGHETKEMSTHLALIPLGSPGGGEIQAIVMPRVSEELQVIDMPRWVSRIVAGSSEFRMGGD